MGYKILLVDDDTELVKMLSKYFERKKYRVITAQKLMRRDRKQRLSKFPNRRDQKILDIL